MLGRRGALVLAIVNDSLVVAHPIAGGFTWTLASRLGQLLAKAESQFGPRDRSFTILGVEFRAGVPQLWFPGNCGHVIVQLGLPAMQEPNRAMFQLSHECVHLLDPAGGATNNLEEGVATYFGLEFMQSELGVNYSTGDPRYDAACTLVRTMLSVRGDAVKELRRLHGPLRSITARQILTVCSGINPSVAQQLASPF
jgi:hypothetical protein